jgi:aspartate kinase
LSFRGPRGAARVARETLEPIVADVGIVRVSEDPTMGKVSIVGAGMKSHPGVAAKVFSTLGAEGINIEMISTSPIKISCVVQGDQVTPAVKALHEAFELGADDIRVEHPFEQGAPT